MTIIISMAYYKEFIGNYASSLSYTKVLFFYQYLVSFVLQSEGMQRNYLQVLEEILDACRKPKARTQLIDETGVTMRKLHFYFKDLLEQDFIKFHHRKKTYVNTEKGLKFLHMGKGFQDD